MVLEKTLESLLDSKDIKPVNPKGTQSWIFIGRTDAEAEAPILWSCDVKSWFIGKDPVPGKDWGQEEKGVTGNEMVGWHHWLSGHEVGQTLKVVKDREIVRDREAWCAHSPWSCKESDMTEGLNNNYSDFLISHWKIPTSLLGICLIFGGLASMGSHRVGHDWSNLAATAVIVLWVCLPGRC